MSKKDEFVTTFGGRRLPSLGDVMYVVRRKVKTNVHNKRYTTSYPTDVEIVSGQLTSLNYFYGARPNEELAPIWIGTIFVDVTKTTNGLVSYGGETVEFGPLNSSAHEDTAKLMYEYYCKNGMCTSWKPFIQLQSGVFVTDAMIEAVIGGRAERCVEGSKNDTGFMGFNYCDEHCPHCGMDTYNLPVDRVSLCAHCEMELFPCSVCEESCDWNSEDEGCHRFTHSEAHRNKMKSSH